MHIVTLSGGIDILIDGMKVIISVQACIGLSVLGVMTYAGVYGITINIGA